ncbi:MAG: hypothetical protein IKR85_04375 [Clostridia bacterium]|nr:hypothetical protein [Clostridia bacterium]
MLGTAVLAAFELSGCVQAFALCKRRCVSVKIWLGLVAGLMEMMWLPSLFAFIFDFTLTAQLCALGLSVLTALLTAIKPGLKNDLRIKRADKVPAGSLLTLILIITPLIAYLHYTHNFKNVDGALYVGQSTYGDLCMHASFATGLIDSAYPAEYTLLPGTLLGYPYLVDALSASMLIFGSSISAAFAVPGTLMSVLVYAGFYIFAWELTRRKSAALLAVALLLLNGGLGFLYTLDLGGQTGDMMLKSALNDYYKAPANQPDYNLRWVNALCDMLIPQRTLMAGWLCVIPALYLLYTAMKSRRLWDFAFLGCFAGPMVMIHTHSFLALGAISLGAFADRLIRDKGHRGRDFRNFALYGIIAGVIALPQLLVWTFPQTVNGGSLRACFGWVNNINTEAGIWIKDIFINIRQGVINSMRSVREGHLLEWINALRDAFLTGDAVNVSENSFVLYVLRSLLFWIQWLHRCLRDGYFWFWIKNVGPMYLLLPAAVLTCRNRRIKALGLGALLLYILADNVLFQPNAYDNNKLFYVAYIAVLPVGCALVMDIYDRLREIKLRSCLLAAFITVCTLSGAISIARELKSEYQIFSASQVEAGEFIKEHTFSDSTVLTANNHNNVAASLAGRKIVCGSSLYLHFHGLDYGQREADAVLMLQYPFELQEMYREYRVDYVYVSNNEKEFKVIWNGYVPAASLIKEKYTSDEAALEMMYPLIYEGGEWYDTIRIYAVSERAIERWAAESSDN